MCVEATYDGEHIETVNQLCDLLGRENVVIADRYGELTLDDFDGHCLCSINMEASVKKTGHGLKFDGHWYFLSPPEETAKEPG